jgi:hypothetical protein
LSLQIKNLRPDKDLKTVGVSFGCVTWATST